MRYNWAVALQRREASSTLTVARGQSLAGSITTICNARLHSVKSCGNIFSIAERILQPTAKELHEALRADVKLAELDLYADLAAFWEEETVPELRQQHAAWYRQLLGVHPAKRDAFREGLLRISVGRGTPVEDLAELIRRS